MKGGAFNMEKSNKELAVELTITFMQSWNSKTNTQALNLDNAVNVLKGFEKALSNMDAKEA